MGSRLSLFTSDRPQTSSSSSDSPQPFSSKDSSRRPSMDSLAHSSSTSSPIASRPPAKGHSEVPHFPLFVGAKNFPTKAEPSKSIMKSSARLSPTPELRQTIDQLPSCTSSRPLSFGRDERNLNYQRVKYSERTKAHELLYSRQNVRTTHGRNVESADSPNQRQSHTSFSNPPSSPPSRQYAPDLISLSTDNVTSINIFAHFIYGLSTVNLIRSSSTRYNR